MYCCRLWSRFCHPPTPPPSTRTLLHPPALLLLPPYPPPPSPSLARTALRLPLLGNCLCILPACSVIGRWHGGVPLPDPASCANYCLLVFHSKPVHPPIPNTHTRLSLTRTTPPASSSLLPSLGNTFRHPCLLGISLARAGWPGPAALMFSGKA